MTFKSFMGETRKQFSDNLNAFLASRSLKPVHHLNSILGIEKKPLSIAVFPTAANGSTFAQEGDADVVRFTVQFFCNSNATDNGLAQGEEYYSALLEFIQSETFGDSSSLDGSILCRMDEGEPVNGAVFNVVSRISSNCDFGWD